MGSTQLQLILTNDISQKRVFYTSDIGGLTKKNHYVGVTEIPNMHNSLTILESTYGNPKRINKKTRRFDMEHLKVAIIQFIDFVIFIVN